MTKGKLDAMIWARQPGDGRPLGGWAGQTEPGTLPAVHLWDGSVPADVRRAIIARMRAGDHNGLVGLGHRCVYEWQG